MDFEEAGLPGAELPSANADERLPATKNDMEAAIKYLKHHAAVKSWPRLQECAEVMESWLEQYGGMMGAQMPFAGINTDRDTAVYGGMLKDVLGPDGEGPYVSEFMFPRWQFERMGSPQKLVVFFKETK